MNTLTTITNTQTMTSTELVDLINQHRIANGHTVVLLHFDFMKKIRRELDAGILAEGNISLGEYLDSNNQKRSINSLTKWRH